MTKTYKANTCIGVNVVLASKKNRHITFIAQSDGSSMFITDNVEIQQALERHYQFGTLFRLVATSDGMQAAPEEAESVRDQAQKDGENGEVEKIPVTDFNAAKEYLAEHYQVSRTRMRSQKQILEQAALHNIEFEGLS